MLLLIQKYYRFTTRSSNCSLAILALGGTDQCPASMMIAAPPKVRIKKVACFDAVQSFL